MGISQGSVADDVMFEAGIPVQQQRKYCNASGIVSEWYVQPKLIQGEDFSKWFCLYASYKNIHLKTPQL